MTAIESPKFERLNQEAQNTLLPLVRDQDRAMALSQYCFVFSKDDLAYAQKVLVGLDRKVQELNGVAQTNVFGQYYGDDKILVFWRADVTQYIVSARSMVNRQLREENLPLLPEINIVTPPPPHET